MHHIPKGTYILTEWADMFTLGEYINELVAIVKKTYTMIMRLINIFFFLLIFQFDLNAQTFKVLFTFVK